jgi:hypothetical protein
VAVQAVVDDYDFKATVVRVADPVRPWSRARQVLSLPMLNPTAGSYGR